MSIRIARILAVLTLAAAVAPEAAGDGKAFKGFDASGWRRWDEREQRAYISCDGTTQRMIVAIRLDDPGRRRPPAPQNPHEHTDARGLWLLPIRAPADAVKLDLVDELPHLLGRDPRHDLAEGIRGVAALIRLTQLWPAPFDLLLSLPTLARRAEVAMSIDRFGLHAEVLAVDSMQALSRHLLESGAPVPAEELASFAPYIDGRHCIVTVWIASPEQARRELREAGRDPAVWVEFPSTTPWYPMRATGGYGNLEIPVTLYVEGLVRLAERGAVQRPITRHFRRPAGQSRDEPMIRRWTGRAEATPLDYTVITLDEPADRFTADFTFAPTSPRGWWLSTALSPVPDRSWLTGAIGTSAILGALAVAGAGAARLLRQPARVGAVVGLCGVLTLLTVMLVMRSALAPESVRRLRDARALGEGFVLWYTLLVVGSSLLITLLASLLAPVATG